MPIGSMTDTPPGGVQIGPGGVTLGSGGVLLGDGTAPCFCRCRVCASVVGGAVSISFSAIVLTDCNGLPYPSVSSWSMAGMQNSVFCVPFIGYDDGSHLCGFKLFVPAGTFTSSLSGGCPVDGTFPCQLEIEVDFSSCGTVAVVIMTIHVANDPLHPGDFAFGNSGVIFYNATFTMASECGLAVIPNDNGGSGAQILTSNTGTASVDFGTHC